jgi:hypothetical protein
VNTLVPSLDTPPGVQSPARVDVDSNAVSALGWSTGTAPYGGHSGDCGNYRGWVVT